MQAACELTGIIVAGGSNRRMGGRWKALLTLNGVTFIECQTTIMRSICKDIVMVTHQQEALAEAFGCQWIADGSLELPGTGCAVRLVADKEPGLGPLGGIQAGLAAAACEYAWIVACDMPFLSARAAAAMLEQLQRQEADAVVPEIGGRLQPLHAVYSRRCLEPVERLLAEGQHKLMRLLEETKSIVVGEAFFQERGIEVDFARNVNSPEDYESLIRI
jgi:molybdopterin-guanine dinucleotide biosynthesis protein A